MSKSAFIRARIEPELKSSVEVKLKRLGVTTTQLISMIYRQIDRSDTIPVDLHIPNAETKKVLDEARLGLGVTICNDIEDMFNKLEI